MREEKEIRVHIRVSGVVQGVGYRFFTRSHATKMGIKGYVRNMPDGTVEIEAEADREKIDSFIEKLNQGPPAADVSEIETEEVSGKKKYDGFEVRF
jgi:acylphosphatase